MYFGTGSWHIVATVARTKEICYTGHLREPSAEGDPHSDMLFLQAREYAVARYKSTILKPRQHNMLFFRTVVGMTRPNTMVFWILCTGQGFKIVLLYRATA